MSTATLTIPRTESLKTNWIISKRQDLTWFIGSSIVGYFALAVISLAPPTIMTLTLIWMFLINGPHFFATATRTYLESEQRKQMRLWLWMIVPFSILPVAIVMLGGGRLLFVLASLWGTFHIAKQHVGFVMLYKRKNGERNDLKLDKMFLLVSQCLPLALFIVWYLSPTSVGPPFRFGLAVQVLLSVAYIVHQVIKYRRREEMNWPKLMLLALVIPLHWLAFVLASNNPLQGVFIFTIGTNIGHALQYHRLTWFHNHNRYRERTGLSGLLSKRAWRYYVAAFGLYLTYFIAREAMPQSANEFIFAGPIFMHYLLDARIWRIKGNPELARALNL